MKAQIISIITVIVLSIFPATGSSDILLCRDRNDAKKTKIKLTFGTDRAVYNGAIFRLEDKYENHAIFISKQQHSDNQRGFMIGLSVLQIDMRSLDVEIGSVFSVSKLGNLKVPEIVLLPSVFLKCGPE